MYHAHTAWLPGGFLGVDLFFAISGFLITRGLLAEHEAFGRVDLRRFWLRRARRLLPAALVFIFVLIAAAQAFFPDDVRSLRWVAVAAVGYVTNWYLVLSEQPYFETVGRPQMLQHLWSLAVEEQFYLIWPPVLLLALRIAPRRVVLAATALLGLASAGLMAALYADGAGASRLYYGTDTHAVGLLLGAALAFLEPAWRAREGRRFTLAADGTGLAALIAMAFLFAWLAEWRPLLYQGGFVIAALLSVALIMSAAVPGRFARCLGSHPFRWIGVRSYSIYLWHPPMLALAGVARLDVPPAVLAAVAAAATILVADLSYRYVETPIRSGGIRNALDEFRRLRPDTRWAIGGAASCALAAVIAGAALAPAPTPPSYLAVAQISGVLTAPAPADPATSAPSWVVPRDAVGGSAAEAVSRSAVPVRTPTAGLTVRSLSAVVTATVSPAPASSTTPGAAPEGTVEPATSPMLIPEPTALPAEPPGGPFLAIGDSVMLGAASGLAQAFGTIEVDAAIGRDVATTLRILRERRAADRLPSTVIVQVGNNGPITRPQMDELMQTLSGVRRVVIVDLHVPQPWEAPNNTMLADAVARHPNARLAAWHAASNARADLFWDDMHLRQPGVDSYVALIVRGADGP
ncbi:MAG: acyltransferase family protein [Dehalococcoidia bacterium]